MGSCQFLLDSLDQAKCLHISGWIQVCLAVYEVCSKINATLSIVPLSEGLHNFKRAHLKGQNLNNIFC